MSPLGSLSTCLIHFRCLALEAWIAALSNVCIVTITVISFYYHNIMFVLL